MYLKQMAKSKESSSNSSGPLSVFTKPWFVIAVVITCFAILTPKIFLPLFRQLFGLGKSNNAENDFQDKMPPHLRMRNHPRSPRGPNPADVNTPMDNDYVRSGPQFGRSGPGPTYTPPSGSGSKSSLLTFLLPVYAVGIGLYMIYTLCKVFNKKEDEKKEEEKDSDYEDNQIKRTLKFKEKSLNKNSNFYWDANAGEFKQRVSGSTTMRSEESEDEANGYERYKDLDPEYVSYIKERRRAKREEQNKLGASLPENKTDVVELTSNVGLTSITNTNVLMNDTLERMKYQLNKINVQLADIEKKGNPFEDPELDSLRMQLTQTEMQMAKIMSIVNTVSSTIEKTKHDSQKIKYSSFEEDDEDFEQEFGKDYRTSEFNEDDDENENGGSYGHDDVDLENDEEEIDYYENDSEKQFYANNFNETLIKKQNIANGSINKQVQVEASAPSVRRRNKKKKKKEIPIENINGLSNPNEDTQSKISQSLNNNVMQSDLKKTNGTIINQQNNKIEQVNNSNKAVNLLGQQSSHSAKKKKSKNSKKTKTN